VTPYVQGEEIVIFDGVGRTRSWGRPKVSTTVLVEETDFSAFYVTYSHKHGWGSTYQYFIKVGGKWKKVTWRGLSDERKLSVLLARKRIPDMRLSQSPGIIPEHLRVAMALMEGS
jgi:hypothetical protein